MMLLATVYTFSKTILAIPWCAGVLAVIVGAVFPWRREYLKAKIICFAGAAVALGIFGPSMQGERIEVSADSFSIRTGVWWGPNEHSFRLADVAHVSTFQVRGTGKRRKMKTYLRVTRNDGSWSDVPVGDLFENHSEEIVREIETGIQAAAQKNG